MPALLSAGGGGGDGNSDGKQRIYKTPAKSKVLATFSLRPATRIFLFRHSSPL